MATQVACASVVCVGVDVAAASTSGSSRRAQSLASFGRNGGEVRAGRGRVVVAGGTQFFKLGGRKEEPEEEEEEEERSSGTRFFSGLGGWGRKAVKEEGEGEGEEEEKPAFFGTQRIRFGTKRGGVESGNGAATAKGGALVRKESTALDALPFGRGRRNDPRTVFVAGATGQIGARISQQLLHAGFNIRGGVRDIYFAQQLAEFATQYGVITREEAKRLNAVEFDFKNVDSVAKAIGNASKVVVTVGPGEDGPRGQVSVDDALKVLEAAQMANVNHFVAVYESGAGSVADGPLAGISSFFSNLFSRGAGGAKDDTYLLDSLVETDLKYTFIRTPSTEGVDDYSSSTSNLVIAAEGASDASGKVSKIQVASVVAAALSNSTVSENKVVMVASDPYAPARPLEESLSVIPMDGRRAVLQAERAEAEEQEAEKAARELAEAEARAAAEEARRAAQLASQLEAEAKRLAVEESRASALAAKAQERAEAAAASVDGLTSKAKELGINTFNKTLSSRGLGLGSFVSKLGTVRGGEKSEPKESTRKAKPDAELATVSAAVESASQDVSQQPVQKPSQNIFGNFFRPQETIFVDDE
ncbi:hypothetical protein M758_9G021200 [Ceratodon purpureus]|nr:hypothetical protein M758_9G021200 [Ceratodon purpureus]